MVAFFVPNPQHPWFGGMSRAWLAALPNGFVENVASIPLVALLTIGLSMRWAGFHPPGRVLVFTAFPFAWMASTALKPSREIFVTPPTLWPAHVTLDNLSRLFEETLFLTYFRNSLAVSSATVGLTLRVSVPAAYSLSHHCATNLLIVDTGDARA